MTNNSIPFTIGSEVRCADGICGTLRRVVFEPVDRVLTHLVVEEQGRERSGRLVPVEFVDPAAAEAPSEIVLSCTLAKYEAFEDAQETQFLPGAGGEQPYEQEQMLSWPFYRLGLTGGPGLGGGGGGIAVNTGIEGFNNEANLTAEVRERVPVGEVQVRRGEHVHATDGSIGRVQGLIVDAADHRVTHVLLDEGHLWGQKRVAIPIDAVTDVLDGVQIDLTKDQVRDLPPVDIELTD